MKQDVMDSELECPNCENMVIFEQHSDSIYSEEMDDEVWWDNFVCPECDEIFNNKYSDDFYDKDYPTTSHILRHNNIKERFIEID